MDGPDSLLCRDNGPNAGLRVGRAFVDSEFFVSDYYDYQGDLQDAHAQLGAACLETMIEQLFSIYASLKIPGLLMQMLNTSHTESNRTFTTLRSIVLSIGGWDT